jgi:hypothetical protein
VGLSGRVRVDRPVILPLTGTRVAAGQNGGKPAHISLSRQPGAYLQMGARGPGYASGSEECLRRRGSTAGSSTQTMSDRRTLATTESLRIHHISNIQVHGRVGCRGALDRNSHG